jgi:hypothetical protein
VDMSVLTASSSSRFIDKKVALATANERDCHNHAAVILRRHSRL